MVSAPLIHSSPSSWCRSQTATLWCKETKGRPITLTLSLRRERFKSSMCIRTFQIMTWCPTTGPWLFGPKNLPYAS